jgi:uncharacterized membrane protein
MVEAHVLDAWTDPADRARPLFGYAMMLAGFGAPLFLFLAGVAAVLSAESKFRKTGNFSGAWQAVVRRGWQVFGLAFLFRLQSYILSGASSAISLLKVDILNIMGPSIAMAAWAGRLVRSKAARGVVFAAATAAIALLTPVVRTAPLVAWLPDPLEWYVRPTPGRTNFTLFPWAGFVFAGAAVGVLIDALKAPERTRQLQVALAVAGASIALLAYQASFWPSIYARSEFWTTSPSFFFLRVGLLTALLPGAYLWDRAPMRHKFISWSPLEEFGRASLFVYWIHVEMVYGFFSRPIRRGLSLEEAVAVYVLFTVLLLGLVRVKNWLVQGKPIYLTDSKSVI